MVTLWLSWLFVFGSDGKIEAGLEDLVKKIDEANSQIVTLKADFEQRKEISLLTDPIEMTGTFYLRKPDAMMFVFAPEHDLTMVVNQREMITISEKAKKAERLELPKRKTDLTQMLVAERLDTLVSYFSIGRVDKSQTTGGQDLVLRPVRRKLKDKFKEIRIHVNDAFLIDEIRVVAKDGDVFQLHFSNIEVNPEIPANQFEVEIPSDFSIGNRIEFIFGPGSGF